MNNGLPKLGIIGGTGDLGMGLALRWATAGYSIIIGSRSADKAQEALQRLSKTLTDEGVKSANLEAADNQAAAEYADIVTMTVPFAHHDSTLNGIRSAVQGKILVDVTVPLVPPKVARVQLPEVGSAGQIAQNILGENVHVVSAFQNVAAYHLQAGTGEDCDVLVCGNKRDARVEVVKLVEACGMRGIHAGSIANAAAVEALTSVLIFVNKQYKSHAGIRITGVDQLS